MTGGDVYDVAVVGLGGLGSATAWQAARRGKRVLGLERFSLGAHHHGATHGDTRIIRLSYHTPAYVAAAMETYQDWSALETDCGEPLVERTGGVDLFPVGAAIEVEDYVDSMTAMGVPYEVLTAAVARGRWPGLAVPDGATVVFQDRTGIAPPSRGVQAMQAQATRFGADLRGDQQVVELADLAGEAVSLRTADGERYLARRVVVAADAWTNDVLASLDASVPLTVTKEQTVHFAVGDGDEEGRGGTHSFGAFPVWIWMDDPSYYGFPSFREASVKVAQDCGGLPVDPDARTFEPDREMLARTQAFVRDLVPGAGDVLRVSTCLYTLTPDRDFVVDRVPGHDNVVVGLGAAHGFKFAPWFGRVLADLATTGSTSSDIGAFTMTRRALTDPDAPQTWLV